MVHGGRICSTFWGTEPNKYGRRCAAFNKWYILGVKKIINWNHTHKTGYLKLKRFFSKFLTSTPCPCYMGVFSPEGYLDPNKVLFHQNLRAKKVPWKYCIPKWAPTFEIQPVGNLSRSMYILVKPFLAIFVWPSLCQPAVWLFSNSVVEICPLLEV